MSTRFWRFLRALVLLALCGVALAQVNAVPPALRLSVSIPGTHDGATLEKSYLRGEPIYLELALSSPEAEQAMVGKAASRATADTRPGLQICPPGHRWIDFVSLRIERGLFGGKPALPADFDWRATVPRTAISRVVAQTMGSEAIRVPFVIPPNVGAILEPGRYAVTAIYDTTAVRHAAGWRGRLVSAAVVLTVEAPANPVEEAAVLSRQADYAFERERNFPQAEHLSARATRLTSQEPEAWYQLGLASAANGRWHVAIPAYERYLALGGSDLRGQPARPAVRHRIYMIERRMEVEGRIRTLRTRQGSRMPPAPR